MAIVKIEHKKTDFAIIDNKAIRDNRLTWAARGLLCYLLSMPDNWEIYAAHLIQESPGGRDHVYTLLSELEKFGYASKAPRRVNNRFDGTDWTVHESPLLPYPALPDTDRPYPENPTLRINNNKKTYNKKKRSTRKTSDEISFREFLQQCKTQGIDQLPPDDPIFDWAQEQKLPDEFMRIAWFVFAEDHLNHEKCYKDWRAKFRIHVKRNWIKIWWINPQGEHQLNTAGLQARRSMLAREQRRTAA